MTVTTEFETHKKTGLPIQETPSYKVGDLVTESINGDGHPGVVVHATAKTVYVAGVDFIGSFSKDDSPGYNGYGDSGSIVIDEDSVKAAIERGKSCATKYVHHVSAHSRKGSFNDQEKYGEEGFHPASWRRPGGYFYLSPGARYRQNPHV